MLARQTGCTTKALSLELAILGFKRVVYDYKCLILSPMSPSLSILS